MIAITKMSIESFRLVSIEIRKATKPDITPRIKLVLSPTFLRKSLKLLLSIVIVYLIDVIAIGTNEIISNLFKKEVKNLGRLGGIFVNFV